MARPEKNSQGKAPAGTEAILRVTGNAKGGERPSQASRDQRQRKHTKTPARYTTTQHQYRHLTWAKAPWKDPIKKGTTQGRSAFLLRISQATSQGTGDRPQPQEPGVPPAQKPDKSKHESKGDKEVPRGIGIGRTRCCRFRFGDLSWRPRTRTQNPERRRRRAPPIWQPSKPAIATAG